MRIKQISVNGLFGIFDHVIPLNLDDRITIIHGPNGFGKTAILRLLNGFFNSKYSELRNIPFENFQIHFEEGSLIEIVKTAKHSKNPEKHTIMINFYEDRFSKASNSLSLDKLEEKFADFRQMLSVSSSALSSALVNKLVKRSMLNIYLDATRENIDSSLTSQELQEDSQEDTNWLEDLKKRIRIYLIESQRLLNLVSNYSSQPETHEPTTLSTVSAYSNDLAKLMQDKFKEYGTISQSLDRTFPVRVVKQQPSQDLTDEQLREQLNELEKTRSRLIEVGLLDRDENSEFQIQPQDIDDSTKNALSVYVEDVEKKLSVFDEIASKLELLRKIINQKFSYSYKEIKFSKEKGFGFKTHYNSISNSNTLSPTDLSSGEQHELVLIYELLFKVEPDSLVLIDEPELSLHVGWQVQFLKDLQEITKLADLDILMATHSPDIIQDSWDLTVELKGPEK